MNSFKRKGSYSYLPNTDNDETDEQILENLKNSSYSKTKITDRIFSGTGFIIRRKND